MVVLRDDLASVHISVKSHDSSRCVYPSLPFPSETGCTIRIVTGFHDLNTDHFSHVTKDVRNLVVSEISERHVFLAHIGRNVGNQHGIGVIHVAYDAIFELRLHNPQSDPRRVNNPLRHSEAYSDSSMRSVQSSIVVKKA